MRLCQANSELLGCLQLSMGNTCVKHRLAPLQQRPWRLLGSHSQPQRKLLLEPIRISQPFSTQAPLCGARCWRYVFSFFHSTLLLFNLLLLLTFLAHLCQPPELLPVLITSLLQPRDVNSNFISLSALLQSLLKISIAEGGTIVLAFSDWSSVSELSLHPDMCVCIYGQCN